MIILNTLKTVLFVIAALIYSVFFRLYINVSYAINVAILWIKMKIQGIDTLSTDRIYDALKNGTIYFSEENPDYNGVCYSIGPESFQLPEMKNMSLAEFNDTFSQDDIFTFTYCVLRTAHCADNGAGIKKEQYKRIAKCIKRNT